MKIIVFFNIRKMTLTTKRIKETISGRQKAKLLLEIFTLYTDSLQ